MSEKVSKALISILNEMTDVETMLYKVQGAIFVKKNDELIKDKISYLYNLLQVEAESYNQNMEKEFDFANKIIDIYRKKLNIVYDELYLQYVNIQNEIGDARLNQKAAMINYQKVINDSEINDKDYENLKLKLKNKNEVYDKIIEKCQIQFDNCINNFENKINSCFFIKSNLQVINEKNIFQKLKNKISNLFAGNKKYLKSLEEYEKFVNNIDVEKIVKDLREQTIEFVTDILEIKDVNLNEAV